jgi:hypothetical protein
VTAELVAVFARPLHEKLAALTGDAAAIAAVQAELEVAALSFGAYAQQQAKHAEAVWGSRCARPAADLTTDLRATATALAAGTALADRAAAAVHTGQSTVRDLLAGFTEHARHRLAEARVLGELGRYDAVITASAELAAQAETVADQAETAVRSARRVLTDAARQLAGLTALLPEPA